MSRLLLRSAVRYHLRHPWQAGLALLGVALGVAVVVSIDLATASAREAFRVSTERVAGRATHRIVGGPGGVPEEVYVALRVEAGVRRAAPVVEGWVGSTALPGRALRLLGVDAFAEAPVRSELAGGVAGESGPAGLDVTALLTDPDAAFVSGDVAVGAGLGVGDALPVEVDGRTDTLRVAGTLGSGEAVAREGLRDLVVVDVALAQELLERRGRLTRIDLVLEGAGEGVGSGSRGAMGGSGGGVSATSGGGGSVAAVEAVLPPGIRLEETGTRTQTLSEMIRAFDLNLRALGLLALLFGGFLIYNTVSFSIVQRRELLGRLRALGVTRREVFGLVVGESAVVGLMGGLLGLGLGVLLGRGLVGLVTRTINDLYFVLSVEGVRLSGEVLARGWILGLVTTVGASLPAVWEAISTPPRATLSRSFVEERVRLLVPRLAWMGLGLTASGGALLLIPSRSVILGFVSLFGLVLGFALLTPLATVWSVRILLPLIQRSLGILGTLAARGVTASLSRTGPAAAALVVAVSVTVGLGVMISSFRGSVGAWLDATLQGDVYVSVPSPISSRPEGTLERSLAERLVSVEGVAGATRYRNVELPSRFGPLRLVAVTPSPDRDPGVQLLAGGEGAIREVLRSGEGVLISEPLAFRSGVDPGSEIALQTGVGERRFPVAGVFRDYGSDRGAVMLSGDLYRRLWGDPGVSSLALHAAPGVAAEALVQRVREAAESGSSPQRISVVSNRQLREGSLEVFDRTFAITRVLRSLAFVVAFIGILAALMALQLERSRELGVLRANGLTPDQVWKMVTAQTGLLGTVCGLLAVAPGVILALVMVHVVNRRSFGWSLDLDLSWSLVTQSVGLAVLGALLAGLYPAWKMARTSPALALREE